MLIVYGVMCFCALTKIGAKAELHVYFEDIGINVADSDYFDEENSDAYVDEDNTISSVLSIKKKLPEDAEGHFVLLGLSNGKYTMPTGLDLRMGLCDMLEEPILVGPFFAELGLSSDDCPPSPGDYSRHGYTLPMETLPDDFPENKYMAMLEIVHGENVLVQIEVYVDVQS